MNKLIIALIISAAFIIEPTITGALMTLAMYFVLGRMGAE